MPHRPREENEPVHCIVFLCAWLNLGDKHMMAAASGGCERQWSADHEINVLALPEPTNTTDCLIRTLKQTQIVSSSKYKLESLNSDRHKVIQDKAWIQRKIVHTSAYHHRVCAMLKMKNAHVCSTGLPRTRGRIILRALSPELWHAIGAFILRKS